MRMCVKDVSPTQTSYATESISRAKPFKTKQTFPAGFCLNILRKYKYETKVPN